MNGGKGSIENLEFGTGGPVGIEVTRYKVDGKGEACAVKAIIEKKCVECLTICMA